MSRQAKIVGSAVVALLCGGSLWFGNAAVQGPIDSDRKACIEIYHATPRTLDDHVYCYVDGKPLVGALR